MSTMLAANVVQLPKPGSRAVGLPDSIAKDMTGDPLGDLSKVLIHIWAAGSLAMAAMERERDFKAKCRKVGLDPDIARKVSLHEEDPIESVIFGLSRIDTLITYAQRQCERLIQSAATRAANPAPRPPRRRKAK